MKHDSDSTKKNERPSDLKKEAKKFREKRDLWKARNAIKRKQLQATMSKVTDIAESRDKWKKEAKEYKMLLENAQKELEKAKQNLELKENEIESLKKKSSHS